MKKCLYVLAACLFLAVATAQAGQVRIVQQNRFTDQSAGRNAVLKIENNDQTTYYVSADPNTSTLFLTRSGQGTSLVAPGSAAYLLFETGGTLHEYFARYNCS